MALDYLPFMGILIVWLFGLKEPTLCQFSSARFKMFVDYQMLTISQFSGWGKVKFRSEQRQFPSARFKMFVDYQMLTISQFSGWGKVKFRSEQRQFYREYGRETLSHEARAVEVISFLRANRRMSTFRSTLKELGFVFLNMSYKRFRTCDQADLLISSGKCGDRGLELSRYK